MTVSSEVARTDYVGNGSVAAYATTFQILDEDDLLVYQAGALLTRGADYTVAISASTRLATVTLTAGNLANGAALALVSGEAVTQPTSLRSSGAYSPNNVERALDRLTMQVRSVKETARHAVRFPQGENVDGVLPAPASRVSKVFGTDASGNFELIDRDDLESGGGGAGVAGDIGAIDITAEPYNAPWDGLSHPVSAETAAAYNAAFSGVGAQGAYAFTAGQEQDAVALQCALWTAANTGERVQLPAGNGRMGGYQLRLEWTATPITGQPARPIIAGISGVGHRSTALVWDDLGDGEIAISLLGTSNPYAVSCHLEKFRVYMEDTCHEGAVCLRVGDCKETFSMFRVFLEGANGMMLKVASSVTYAQMCTHFVECKFDANYGTQWTQAGGEYFAVIPDSGGSLWDNVLFDSCLFGGLVYCRAFLATFVSCQFYTNTRRASIYDGCLYAPIGRITARDCYFEDYRVAILLTNGFHDMRGATIDSCHFSGTANDVGSPLCKHAVQIIGFGVNKLGMFTITNNHMNFAAPDAGGTNGHHCGTETSPGVFDNVDINAPGTRIFLSNNVNIYDPYESVILDVTGSYMFSFDGSDDVNDGLGRSTMTRADVIGTMRAGLTFVPRYGAGTGNGQVWGSYVEKHDESDSYINGWSSTTYTTGGALAWLGNGMAFEYIPAGSVKRIGVGTSGAYYLEIAAGGVTLQGWDIVSDNLKVGTGSPEGAVVGKIGDLYRNLSGGAGTTLYVKESGASTNTGWVAK